VRIAIFSDEYLPESTRAHAKMLHELALELKALGNEVIVVTPGLPIQQTLLSVCFFEGIEVWKFKSGLLRGNGNLLRAINESLLSIRAWRSINHTLVKRPFDLCINYSPTIFFGPLMRRLKRKYGVYIYLILRDIFPKWIIDEGIIKDKSLIACYFQYFEHLNYRVSDDIGLMSASNVDYFRRQYPINKCLSILPNWANHEIENKLDSKINIRERFNLQGKVVFFYGGNIGFAQDIINLAKLAKSMKYMTEAHFLFVGQGGAVEELLNFKNENKLNNITYLSSVSQLDYQAILSQVDIGMLSLAKSHQVNHHPGKLLGYMKYSLPILASLNRGNDLIDFINNEEFGLAHINGDDESLYQSAKVLLQDQFFRVNFGENSRKVLISHFTTESAAKKILNSFRNSNSHFNI
jgi:O26-antigen biosynthesis N-acetyl-L-fucosamine transferase